MPDESGRLNQADITQIDRFLGRLIPDKCLTCPITGERIPVTQWKITDRLCLVPLMGVGLALSKDHIAMLHLTSPAGGVAMINAVAAGLVRVAQVN